MDNNENFNNDNYKLFFNELNGESERACAIIGGVFIDNLLGQILENYLLENKDVYKELLKPENINSPLGSFGSRILMTYGIGLITKDIYEVLKIINKIRNKFAHNLKLSFSDDVIKNLCNEILIKIKKIYEISNSDSRNIFQSSVSYIMGKLTAQINDLNDLEISGKFKSVLKLIKKKIK